MSALWRWRAISVPVAWVALALGCGADSTAIVSSGAEWVDEERNRTDAIDVVKGDAHCDWDSVTILEVDSSIVPPDVAGDQTSDFVHDPDNVLPDGLVEGRLDPQASLPSDAEPTGFETTSGVELWYSATNPDGIYLQDGDIMEMWPRGDAGCD